LAFRRFVFDRFFDSDMCLGFPRLILIIANFGLFKLLRKIALNFLVFFKIVLRTKEVSLLLFNESLERKQTESRSRIWFTDSISFRSNKIYRETFHSVALLMVQKSLSNGR
jgi:hypothetical protein